MFKGLLLALVSLWAFSGTSAAQSFSGCLNPDQQTDIPTAECDALVDLFESTNGTEWTKNDGWMTTPTPCDWEGITCVSDRVFRIVLTNNALLGQLPTTLGELDGTWRLDLRGNDLDGPIPAQIAGMSALRELFLNDNSLGGSIPTELGKMPNITDILLADNGLTGSIPAEFGNLPKLEYLELNGNELEGSLPKGLGKMSNLLSLQLGGNKITGDIPNTIGDMPSLVSLDLSDNNLSGEIPIELADAPNLFSLALNDNQLEGPVPFELATEMFENLCIPLDPAEPPFYCECDFTANASLCVPDNAEYQQISAANGICGLLLDATCQTSLAVEFTSLDGSFDAGEIELRWASQKPNPGSTFQIQVLRDTWTEVGNLEVVAPARNNYSFIVAEENPGSYRFRVKHLDIDATISYSPEVEVVVEWSGRHFFRPIYPHPANTSARIEFGVNTDQRVEMTMTDLMGRHIKSVYSEFMSANVAEQIDLDVSGLAPGLYLIDLKGEVFQEHRSLLVRR